MIYKSYEEWVWKIKVSFLPNILDVVLQNLQIEMKCNYCSILETETLVRRPGRGKLLCASCCCVELGAGDETNIGILYLIGVSSNYLQVLTNQEFDCGTVKVQSLILDTVHSVDRASLHQIPSANMSAVLKILIISEDFNWENCNWTFLHSQFISFISFIFYIWLGETNQSRTWPVSADWKWEIEP